MKAILKLIRPKQWMKNMFVFLPMFFGGSLLDFHAIVASVLTFVAFCFAASSIYCYNDLVDVEADRRHPVKCKRPIAAGLISEQQAYGLMFLMFLMSAVAIWLLSLSPFTSLRSTLLVGGIVIVYWLLNLAYCAKLKQYAIIDVCVVSFGFVLRILAGGFATSVFVSKWLVLMTFLLTLFLSFAKRRDDVLRMNETGEAPRKNTIRYNLTFINEAITITASVMLVCYIMYTVSPEVIAHAHNDYLYLTTILVLLGLLRYIQISVVDKKSGDPTKVMLRDRYIQLIVATWLLVFLVILYVL